VRAAITRPRVSIEKIPPKNDMMKRSTADDPRFVAILIEIAPPAVKGARPPCRLFGATFL